MSIDPITYQSPQLIAGDKSNEYKTETLANGLTCRCTGLAKNNQINITWIFNWEKLKKHGVDGLSGQITVKSSNNCFQPRTHEVDLTGTTQSIEEIVTTSYTYSSYKFTYELSLLPYFNSTEIVSYKEIFKAAEGKDVILVVEGKKLHVNKAFLSFHSEFFRALFSGYFKEGQMDEIPVYDISYNDFGLLLSSFYPKPVFPNDKTVEKLLEMADRFSTPSVIGIVEYHLIHNSKIKNEKLMWMADAYGMEKLLQKTIFAIDNTARMNTLKASPEYKKLSDGTKAKVLDQTNKMSIEPITYQSPKLRHSNNSVTAYLPNGLTCHCFGVLQTVGYINLIKIVWKFDWEILKEQGIDGLSGQITIKSPSRSFQPTTVDVNLTETTQSIDAILSSICSYSSFNFTYEFSLLPYFNSTETASFDEMFLPSPKNDAVLVVDGKKLHVNKAFLSYHSDFFGALFSSNFREGQMEEIPINDVSYEDFCSLLGTFLPNPVFPNDNRVETLLELADRFMIPSVTRLVEHHLLHNSKMKNEKMMWMADAYGMPKLLQKTIFAINTVAKMNTLEASPEYEKLSDGTKARVLDRLLELT